MLMDQSDHTTVGMGTGSAASSLISGMSSSAVTGVEFQLKNAIKLLPEYCNKLSSARSGGIEVVANPLLPVYWNF